MHRLTACPCTGNLGFAKAQPKRLEDGSLKSGYNYDSKFGDYCKSFLNWDVAFPDDTDEDRKAAKEPFCYIPCDETICPGVPRHETDILWAARDAGFKLCYSFEACGAIDYVYPFRQRCKALGGKIEGLTCSCDKLPGGCSCEHGLLVSGSVHQALNGCYTERPNEYMSGFNSYTNHAGMLLYWNTTSSSRVNGTSNGTWIFASDVDKGDIRAYAPGAALAGPGAIVATAWRIYNPKVRRWQNATLSIVTPPHYSGTYKAVFGLSDNSTHNNTFADHYIPKCPFCNVRSLPVHGKSGLLRSSHKKSSGRVNHQRWV